MGHQLIECFRYIWLLIGIILILHTPVSNGQANLRAIEKRILDSIIGDGRYDSRIRPSGMNTSGIIDGPAIVRVNVYVRQISSIDDVTMGITNKMKILLIDGPCLVRVNIYLRSISKISDLDMEYSVQVTFREQWNDNRLQFDDMNGAIRYLVLTDESRIWKPDLFFSNEKDGHFHNILMPNVLLRIYPNGNVLYSIRISLVLACPMDLKYYPLDKQTCSIQMASYGYTTDDLVFIWKEVEPVQIVKNLNLPRFTLEKHLTEYCTSRTNTGEYSCLRVDLLFKREFSYYLIQIYIPCAMLIFVSWVSFWLDPNATVARVSLGVTTLLSMATQISGINASQPPVSYTKAIDVWTGVCLTFVFAALLEFALVNYASRSDVHQAAAKQQQVQQRQAKWNMEQPSVEAGGHSEENNTTYGMRGDGYRTCEIHAKPLKRKNFVKRWLSKFPTRSKRIDVISRIFFPFMFGLFNLVYWTTYLLREDLRV